MWSALISLLVVCLCALPSLINWAFVPTPQAPPDWKASNQVWGEESPQPPAVFTLKVSDDEIEDLQTRLRSWRAWDNDKNMQHEVYFDYGFEPKLMRELVDYWKEGGEDTYDWRRYEAKINTLGLRSTTVMPDRLKIVYHEVNPGKDKAILFLHGWPGSIWEFNQLLSRLSINKEFQDYSLIVPCLPGYGFSSAPTKEGYSHVEMAGTLHRFMDLLGYNKFYVQGGDWGSIIAQAMTFVDTDADRVIGLHLNFFPVLSKPGHLPLNAFWGLFDDEDSKRRSRAARNLPEILMNTGYMHEQATKPETLAFALSDSPVGLLAWVGEKFQAWSDPNLPLQDKFDKDDLLTNIMLYWITNTIVSSMRLYREYFSNPESYAIMFQPITTPVGLSLFPYELFPPGDTEIHRKFTNIITFHKHGAGGHFAALEHPDALEKDLTSFISRMESGGT